MCDAIAAATPRWMRVLAVLLSLAGPWSWPAGAARPPVDDPRGIYFLANPPASPAGMAPSASAPGLLSDLVWEPLGDGPAAPRVVLLIHGLDELGGIWDDLAPALQSRGYTVARFEYPNDDAIAESAVLLARHLRDLRSRGTERLDIVAHSMGGLVARDCLTRPGLYAGEAGGPDGLPAIERFITLGTPNHGSPLARFRGVLEFRERLIRAYESDNWRALNPDDPESRRGRAAVDLLPGSEFLTELNARPVPRGVMFSIIAARLTDPADLGFDTVAQSPALTGALGTERVGRWVARGKLLAAEIGDGVVPLDSTPLPGVEDYTVVEANHRSMVKRISISETLARLLDEGAVESTPPAIPLVIERLARPAR